jgi:hypothetical protein
LHRCTAAERALQLHRAAPGTVVLYELVEWAREALVQPVLNARTSAADAELAAALATVRSPFAG